MDAVAPTTDGGPATEGAPDALAAVRLLTLRGLLLGSGPRFARDAFGPPLAFYAGWKLAGLPTGIAVATVVSLVAWRLERRQSRPGTMARLSLGFVLVQALIGLASRSAVLYLAQPVLLSGVLGLVFLGSAAAGRPLAGVFAEEVYTFPDEVRTSGTFRATFGRVSVVWGVYLLTRAAIRLLVLGHGSVELFLVVNFVTGGPLMAGLMSWSIWYVLRRFRRSEEWGWALGAA